MAPEITRAELKPRIFGQTYAKYRVTHIKSILELYGIYYTSKATKTELLQLLQRFEEDTTESQKRAVVAFLGTLHVEDGAVPRLPNGRFARFATVTNRRNAISGPSGSKGSKQSHDPAVKEKSGNSSVLEKVHVLECNTCLESLTLDLFPTRRITSTCTHDAATCLNCLREYITSQLADKQWNQLSCPSCVSILSFADVRDFGRAESFERYDRFATLAAMREDANFRTCLNPACDSGQIHESGADQPIMTCQTCAAKSCFSHGVEWHTGQTCEEYDIARETKQQEEQASVKAVKKLAKLCPNKKCKVPLQKNGGCDHFTCGVCRHQFCWRCLASYQLIYTHGNTAHARSCPHHTKNLRA